MNITTSSAAASRPVRAVTVHLWRGVGRRLARFRHRRRMRLAARHPDQLRTRIERARTIVFVCLGNIIRSAFAAQLLRSRLTARADVHVRSAGLATTPGNPADATAILCAQRFGVDLRAHRTHSLDRSDLEEADILLVMEVDHIVDLQRRFPEYLPKIYLFGCLTGSDPVDVADPLRRPPEVFAACFEQIDRGVRRILEIRSSVARDA